MRSLLLTVIFSVVMSISYAQSLRITNTSPKVFGRVGTEIEAPISVKNISSKPVEIKITRTRNNLSSGQESYFCLGKNCFTPKTAISTETKVLGPGEIYEGFRSILKTGLGESSTSITYCFENVLDATDKVCQQITYQVEALESDDILFYNDEISISNIYPNPINEIALMDYTIKDENTKAKLIIHNVLGGIMGEYPLNPFESKLKISTYSFNPGVYFYTLSLSNQSLITKKFIIKR